MSIDIAHKDCIIQDLETPVKGQKQELELATMEKRWNDAQGRLNAVSMSIDQVTHKDESFAAQEMESPIAAQQVDTDARSQQYRGNSTGQRTTEGAEYRNG